MTGITVTVGIKGAFIGAILGVLDHHTSCRGKQKAITRIARREDAVKHVDPSAHTLKQILWFANSHEITRLVRRQLSRRMRSKVIHDVPWFTNTQATYGITIEAISEQGRYAVITQGLIGAALDNSKEAPAPALPASWHRLAQRQVISMDKRALS